MLNWLVCRKSFFFRRRRVGGSHPADASLN